MFAVLRHRAVCLCLRDCNGLRLDLRGLCATMITQGPPTVLPEFGGSDALVGYGLVCTQHVASERPSFEGPEPSNF